MTGTSKSHAANRAVVIGGSLAGLFAARVLSEHFDEVVVLDQDKKEEGTKPRMGVAQGAHFHGLLAKGFDIIKSFYPGIDEELKTSGAVSVDVGSDWAWHHFGKWRVQHPVQMEGLFHSRPLLEHFVQKHTLNNPRVHLQYETKAIEFFSDASRKNCIGVRTQNSKDEIHEWTGALVVDASGRASKAGSWLSLLNFESPHEEKIAVAVGYATRVFRRRSFPQRGRGLFVTPTPPHTRRSGGLFPIEGDRWICTLGGWFNDHPARDDVGFMEFAKSLPVDDIYNIIKDAEPLSDIAVFKFPANQRRRFGTLKVFPSNFLVLGDALASFNPLYGQGMTVAALEAHALSKELSDRSKRFDTAFSYQKIQKNLEKIVDLPWSMAIGEDLRYPEAKGNRSVLTKFLHGYTSRIHDLASHDTDVLERFCKVMHMYKGPETLFHPAIFSKMIVKGNKYFRTTTR